MVRSASSTRAAAAGAPVPVAVVVEQVLGCKWSVRLLELIASGCQRPGRLLRACPGLSAKVMNERLRRMTALGVVRRDVHGDRQPLEVRYVLTLFGARFMRILEEVRALQEALDRGEVPAAEPSAAGTSAHSAPEAARRPGSGLRQAPRAVARRRWSTIDSTT